MEFGCRYRKQGFSYCYVTTVEGIDTGHLKVKVLEGRVGAFRISPVDAEGKPTEQPGHVPQHVILREIPFQVTLLHLSHMREKLLAVFSRQLSRECSNFQP